MRPSRILTITFAFISFKFFWWAKCFSLHSLSQTNRKVSQNLRWMKAYMKDMTFAKDFLATPFLQNVTTDTHYSQRDRQGRSMAFLARVSKDYNVRLPCGIGLDEQTALAIDDQVLSSSFFIHWLSYSCDWNVGYWWSGTFIIFLHSLTIVSLKCWLLQGYARVFGYGTAFFMIQDKSDYQPERCQKHRSLDWYCDQQAVQVWPLASITSLPPCPQTNL